MSKIYFLTYWDKSGCVDAVVIESPDNVWAEEQLQQPHTELLEVDFYNGYAMYGFVQTQFEIAGGL